MPIGNAEQRQAHRRMTQQEHQARYRAERRRQNAKWDFEQFLKSQQQRIQATLAGHTRRVNAARWGTATEGDGYFVITKAGTTETSAPVRREYHEQ